MVGILLQTHPALQRAAESSQGTIEAAQAQLETAGSVEEILGGLVALLGTHLAASIANASLDLRGKRGVLGKVLNAVRVLALDTGRSGQRPQPETIEQPPKVA